MAARHLVGYALESGCVESGLGWSSLVVDVRSGLEEVVGEEEQEIWAAKVHTYGPELALFRGTVQYSIRSCGVRWSVVCCCSKRRMMHCVNAASGYGCSYCVYSSTLRALLLLGSIRTKISLESVGVERSGPRH